MFAVLFSYSFSFTSPSNTISLLINHCKSFTHSLGLTNDLPLHTTKLLDLLTNPLA